MAPLDLPDTRRQSAAWYRSELLWACVAAAVWFAALVCIEVGKSGSVVSLLKGDPHWYYRALAAWKTGRLGPSNYLHGIGMGALGYFTPLWHNPFILWSLIYFVFTNACVWLLLRRIVGLKWAIPSHILLTLTFVSNDIYTSSTNNMTTYALIVYVVLLAIDNRVLGFRKGALLGALYGICFACRYADPILTLPPVVYILVRDFREERRSCLMGMAGFSLLALPWLFFTLYMHHTYLGSITTTPYASKVPYVERIFGGTEGLANHLNVHFFHDTLRNAYQVFVDPRPYARPVDISGPKALLWSMPYLVLAFAGLWYWWQARAGKRTVIYVTLASAAAYFLFYCSFWAFTAHDLQFGCLRYLAGWYYMAAVGAVYALKQLVIHFKEKRSGRKLLAPAGITGAFVLLCILFPTCDHWLLDAKTYKDKGQWTVTTNVANPNTAAIIDGKFDTYWVTPGSMAVGQGIIIDFGDVRTVSQLRFNHGDYAETSFPRQVGVYASDSAQGNMYGVNKVRSGRQNHIWILYFDNLRCRRICVNIKKASKDQWLIHECDVIQ